MRERKQEIATRKHERIGCRLKISHDEGREVLNLPGLFLVVQ